VIREPFLVYDQVGGLEAPGDCFAEMCILAAVRWPAEAKPHGLDVSENVGLMGTEITKMAKSMIDCPRTYFERFLNRVWVSRNTVV